MTTIPEICDNDSASSSIISSEEDDSRVEYILKENPDRFVLYPIRHDDLWKLYKKAEASFWTAEEVDLSEDLKDWNDKLTENEQFFIKNILAFFASSDGIVSENLVINFNKEVQLQEARCFYGFQNAMENIHSEVYSLLIDTYVKDSNEKNRLLKGIDTIPWIRKKANWAFKYMDFEKNDFSIRLVAFAVIEGIFFSGSFCSIFWLKKRGLMPGLCFSNELISRDEGLHCEFACLLYSKLQRKLKQEKVHQIIDDAVQIESEFISKALPVELLGMNSTSMQQYIKYCSDRLLNQLGYEKLYFTTNPFDWMELISIDGKTNFFEKRVSDYSKASINLTSSVTATFKKFELTEDF